MRARRSRLVFMLALPIGATVLMFQASAALGAAQTVEGAYCMQRIFMGPSATVSNSNLVNCAASDIKVSKAISVSPDHCTAGTTFDLTATFQVDVTANSRYDASFFFRIDGGANARGDGTAATGQCSVTQLVPGVPPALNLDGDSCGDLNSGSYSNVTITIPGVSCVDSNGDGFLNLPNCTSWHSNSGTACTGDTNPFDANPDTKSKCVCDDTFQVPVRVETGSIAVTKDVTANDKTNTPSSAPEPGAKFTYTISATNTASVVTVTLDRICDDKFGTIVKVQSAPDCAAGTIGTVAAGDTNCSVPQTLQPNGGSYSCYFKGAVAGNPISGDPTQCSPTGTLLPLCADAGTTNQLTDTVTFFGHDQNNKAVSKGDTAQISISDMPPSANVLKTATSLACAEVNYHVKVTNTDAAEAITLDGLTDSSVGGSSTNHDLTTVHDNLLGTTCGVASGSPGLGTLSASSGAGVLGSIAKNGVYECDFQIRFCGTSNTDVVTASFHDNDSSTDKNAASNTLVVNVSISTP